MFYKEKLKTNNKGNYLQVYYEFMDYVPLNATVIVSYLISVEDYVQKRDQYGYMRVSDEFIQQKFPDMSHYIISDSLKRLEDCGIVTTKTITSVERRRGCRQRWVKLNYEKLDDILL